MTELSIDVVLANVKEDLGISDELQDAMIKRLITKVVDRFKFEYSQSGVDEKYSFIIEDCVIKRYQRRGAEGMTSNSVEGYSASYEANINEFAEYDAQLRRDFDNSKAKLGRAVWI